MTQPPTVAVVRISLAQPTHQADFDTSTPANQRTSDRSRNARTA
ncbi:hypothetical protein [Chondromyces apiculatus]|uniref:Uncharacterized protein n=1 Tax=Chondromyces apiculatus DSM 436 TaxID=1192034 RepID=A0A017T4B8_9BACT|nr:hypothetical protein [Chondromyces apiculatus]EYF03655.1 Hypothetical protein CAP_5266 [Chondromyces apiculatus DSM 436]